MRDINKTCALTIFVVKRLRFTPVGSPGANPQPWYCMMSANKNKHISLYMNDPTLPSGWGQPLFSRRQFDNPLPESPTF